MALAASLRVTALAVVTSVAIGGPLGCGVKVDYAGTTFQCAADEPACPDGQSCIEGVCRDPGFRRWISFDNSPIAEDLTDFPVMLRLDATRVDYALAGEAGVDLGFSSAAEEPLVHEIERWDPDGESLVWVLVPRISASSRTDGIWMNLAHRDQAPGTVWSSFRGVWHLDESPTSADPQFRDSTAAGNHGTVSTGLSVSTSVVGQFGGAVAFDGVDDWITVPNSPTLDVSGQALTLSAWVRLSAPQTVDAGILIKSVGAGYNYQLGVQSENVGNFRVKTTVGTTYLSGPSTLVPERWYHLAGVYDGASARIYIDGIEDTVEAQTGDLIGTTDPLVIGRRELGDDRFFHGLIDEARISSVARTPGWIAAEYRNGIGAFVVFDQ